jgi:IQ domain-containing protein H
MKSMIKGKQAYIVPGVVGSDDIKLSIKLKVPIMSGEPQKNSLYSTKSGAKKIF